MNKVAKTTLLVAGAGLVFYGGSTLYKLYKSGKHLSIRMSGTKDVKLKVNGIANIYLQFYQDIEFANPDEKDLHVKFFDAKILLDNEVVGYTEPVGNDKDFVIKGRSKYEVTNFKIIIPGSNLTSVVPDLFNIIKNLISNPTKLKEITVEFLKRMSIIINAKVNGVKLPETPIELLDTTEKEINTKKK